MRSAPLGRAHRSNAWSLALQPADHDAIRNADFGATARDLPLELEVCGGRLRAETVACLDRISELLGGRPKLRKKARRKSFGDEELFVRRQSLDHALGRRDDDGRLRAGMRNAKDSLDARLSAEDDFPAAADWNHVLAPERGNARPNEPARHAARGYDRRRCGLVDSPDDVIQGSRDGGERASVELVRPEEGARMDDGGELTRLSIVHVTLRWKEGGEAAFGTTERARR